MFGAVAAILIWVIAWWWKRYYQNALPWNVYAWVVVVFCFVASYQAWVDKYEEYDRAKTTVRELQAKVDNKKAKLTAGAYNSYWISSYPLLIVLMHIGNAGESPSVTHDFELSIAGQSVRPEFHQVPILYHLLLGLEPNKTDMILPGDEFIHHRTMRTPVERGFLTRGWIIFDLSGKVPRCSSPMVGTIVFKDINNEKYSVSVAPQSIPPLPPRNSFTGYPDITPPLLDREVILRIEKSRGGDVVAVKTDECRAAIGRG